MTRTPRPFEGDRAAETRAAFDDLLPELRDLLSGVAGCSPYLRGLIATEGDWLRDTLDRPPEDVVAAELDRLSDGSETLARDLRVAKRRVALISALADLGGVWTLAETTEALTRLADACVGAAFRHEVGRLIARDKLPGQGPDDVDRAGGLFVLAMGKMGACELNYSSDIDLIVLFDESRFDADGYPSAQAAFTKATRGACQLLSDQTADGYVFRTDLRLRPDPSVTPVAMAAARAERYYESLGRTWERAAHIKARPCAGDLSAGERYLAALRPFVWRRHLDFAAIEDAHAMRLRIREHKGLGGPITLAGHDMKLGRGGIREIEFFTQTRQIIAGGRDPALRVRGTCAGLAQLAEAGWIDGHAADELTDHYVAHRTVEHRLQMVADAQTHALPDTDEGFARIAAMMDMDTSALRHDLLTRLSAVSRLTEAFFDSARPAAPMEVPDLTEAQARLVTGWASAPALRSDRAGALFARIRPHLVSRLLQSPQPDRAFATFDAFLRALPAGVQLFSLFQSNPQLIDLIADIAGTTPDLASYLARNAAVLDAVIDGSFFADWPGRETLNASLEEALARATDYEGQLDAARRWARDWHFRIGVHHLRGLVDAAEAGAHYAELAEAVVAAIWPCVLTDMATRHGPPPGVGAAVLAMGSLGAGRLNARSDLDLIVIYDADGVDASDGPRPLAARLYYSRLTQALVTALQAPMAGGRLYEVDMRLRPSGRQGPVATSLSAFVTYQRQEAWVWEHLALTRARPVAGHPDVGAQAMAVRSEILSRPHDRAAVAHEVSQMRARLDKARPGAPWESRTGPGGLQDIELCAATLGLLAAAETRDPRGQIRAGRDAGLIDDAQADLLLAAHAALAAYGTAARLLTPDRIAPDALGSAGAAVLLRATDAPTLDRIRPVLIDHAARAADIFDRLLAGMPAPHSAKAR